MENFILALCYLAAAAILMLLALWIMPRRPKNGVAMELKVPVVQNPPMAVTSFKEFTEEEERISNAAAQWLVLGVEPERIMVLRRKDTGAYLGLRIVDPCETHEWLAHTHLGDAEPFEFVCTRCGQSKSNPDHKG